MNTVGGKRIDQAGTPRAGNPQELCRIAKAQINAGKPRDALRLLELAQKLAPTDVVCWDLLGFCHATLGTFDKSLAAHQNAFKYSPSPPQIGLFLNLYSSMKLLERPDVMESTLRSGLEIHPGHPDFIIKLSSLLLSQLRYDEAQVLLEGGRVSNPENPKLTLELGLLYERSNQIDKLDALIAEIGDPGTVGEYNLLFAWNLRRHKRIAEIAPYLMKSQCRGGRARFEQLSAELAEHHGQFALALDHFAAMNQAILSGADKQETDSYRNKVIAATRDMSPPPGPPVPFKGRSPVFVVGSPRSGTTLVNTMLGGHPDVVIGEELIMRSAIEGEFPGIEQCTDPARIEAARSRYFEIAEKILGPIRGRLLIDKHPMHIAAMPLINRLFPDAPIVLCERHPCAAVLSCFTTGFQPNVAMRGFMTLRGAAQTYDALFSSWTRACELLPLKVHTLRYERMVDEQASEMQQLLAFLGLAWKDGILDNQALAAKRGRVLTASYAQIHQPLYTTAKERWRNYAEQLAPVMPILQPWIERLGYEP